ncbi:MAG: hypothetical protein HY599_01465 [Candidatus Omnitrophica bacterium]|nr:hypothetical protein [Candidatus Omnitrophota bacterium]
MTKCQTPNNHQWTNHQITKQVFDDWDIGDWCLFGSWILMFGDSDQQDEVG